jgi:peroxiredoxin
MTRSWRRIGMTLWIVALVWAAVLLGVHLRTGGAPRSQVLTAQQLANGFAASTIAPVRLSPSGMPLSGAAAPSIRLRGIGGPGRLSDYRGRVTLVTFVDPACTGGCYGTLAIIRNTLRELGTERSQVAVVAVDVSGSANPTEVLGSWWKQAGVGSPGALLVGSTHQLRPVLKAYGIVVAPGRSGLTWTPALYVLNRKGAGERLFITDTSQEGSQVTDLLRAIHLGLSRQT